MASTWDPELIGRVAQAIGEEARNKGPGSQILLGPAVNIHRSPLGGRNGEYMSEDPFLTARMAVGYIKGMQSTGVGACIKHFVCNNQEHDRFDVNVVVGERALREIYFPAFEAGVKEGVRLDGDECLQQGQRHELQREQVPAERRAETRLGIRRAGDERLGHPRTRQRPGGQRPGDAQSQVDQARHAARPR